MLKKPLLFLLFPVFIFLFILETPLAANAADAVYARNGEVYVMIGEGPFMGVYASQKIDANGNRITVRPDGIKLFGDPTKMDNYQALSVDQFRNIYVLAAKLDPGLINIPQNFHSNVDPPRAEGICGIGNDGTLDYHDVLNHCDTMPGNPHGGRGVSDRATEKYAGHAGWSYLQGQTPGGGAHNTGAYAAPVNPPQAALADYAKHNKGAGRSIKRIPLNYWYCGFLDWKANSGAGVSCNGSTVSWQIKFGVKIQRVDLWISHYVDPVFVPAGVNDPLITPGTVIDKFENVFDTVNMQYTSARATMCGEAFHPGSMNPSTDNINTDYKIGFTTTGAGRRYVYSSLPEPKIKKGTIKLTANNTFGIPQKDSDFFNGLDSSQALTATTLSIGAATKSPLSDYIYTAPNNGEVIGFTVADQWDGLGGVRYTLLQPGTTNGKFDASKAKKLRWEKMQAYNVEAGKSGVIEMKNDVKTIAGDGSGSVYYLTDPRAVFDAAGGGDTFHHPNSTVNNLIDLPTPGKPVEYTTSTGGKEWHWKRKFTARAATELYQVEYYTKTETKLNDFTVGQQTGLVLEIYNDANATNLKFRQAVPDMVPPLIGSIKLALATINLAGPPTGNEERMCVDFLPLVPAGKNIEEIKSKDITISARDTNNNLVEIKYEGDEVEEDKPYTCRMENAPPKFSNDFIQKNILSGLVLKDENNNGIKGGFEFSVRPGTACYYWRVEMVEPMKKVLTPTKPTQVAAQAPAEWQALQKGNKSQNINLADGKWYCSLGDNYNKTWDAENGGAPEASPEFSFTPTEPGIYKISLIATARKWNYEILKYPSYVTDRNTAACKSPKTHFLFFDDGGSQGSGGTPGNGVKDGDEDYVGERYIIVTAKKDVTDKYITNVKIDGPSTVKENEIKTWTATADIKFIRSIEHENPNKRMETYNGIGVWDYPDTAVADWGLGPWDNKGEDYATGAPHRPANSVKNGNNVVMSEKMRNFGERAPGSVQLTTVPPELTGVPANIVFGTLPSAATWVAGAGTNANPTVALNRADRGAIEYEWYLAAEEISANGGSKFHGTAIDASVSEPSDPKRLPSICIAKGRLSDDANGNGPGASWSTLTSADREFKNVKVSLRYAFDMPLNPGKYYLYIKFKYPKVKWEGRSEKKDKTGKVLTTDGQLPKADKSNVIFAYYDLVSDGTGQTNYNTVNWKTITTDPKVPAGFPIVVEDVQAPQTFFVSDNPDPANPKPLPKDSIAAGGLPVTGVEYIGGTTGDPYKGAIKFDVCDNNPNTDLKSQLKAMVGGSKNNLNWESITVTKTDDKHYDFDKDHLEKVLEKTINPNANGRLPGQIQDAVNVPAGDYPGYGVDAPYRKANCQLDNPHNVLTKDKIPYDMTGSLPLYALSEDKAGNKITDATLQAKANDGAVLAPKSKHYPNAPARISLVDNDAPSFGFYALRTRDNVYRRYIIKTAGNFEAYLDGPNANMIADKHASVHDDLDWDSQNDGKLKFTTWGATDVAVKDCNLDGSVATLTGQNNPVRDMASLQNNTGQCTQLSPTTNNLTDISVGEIDGKKSYIIKFGGKNIGISEVYNKFAPTNVAFYDFDKILPANAGDMLELFEDARTKFEIAVFDNVDNVIPVTKPVMVNNGVMMAGNCYVDTVNLGDALMLGEVMDSWKPEGSIVETYGIFRDPTPTGPGAQTPFMFVAVKDMSGNATIVKFPIVIRHTLFRPNVINVETRRSE